MGIDVKKNLLYIIIAGSVLIILLIVIVVLLTRKKKYACERCGKSVFPGMVYCEDCTDQRSSRGDTGRPIMTSPQVKPVKEEPRMPRDAAPAVDPAVKKKIRPSGRVIAVITVRRGANPGYKFNFYETQNQVTLGSDPDSDFVIEEDEEVAPRHALISMSEKEGFQVFDKGNTSGLFVNNEQVKQSGLKSGDVIKLGKTELTFARL